MDSMAEVPPQGSPRQSCRRKGLLDGGAAITSAVNQRWAIPMVRYRNLANRIRYNGTEILIRLEKTRFPISDPTGFDKTLQSRKVYIQTSKRTWASPETDQIPMKGKS
jgi:hypothetical protein